MVDDDLDIPETGELTVEPDELDLVQTVEMNQMLRPDTKPLQPVLDATTQSHEVPRELMSASLPTHEQAVLEWFEFEGLIDDDGRIEVPPNLRALLAHRDLVIRLKPSE